MRPGDQQREPEPLPDHAAHHLDRRRTEDDVRREAQFVEQADEVGTAGRHVQQDHRLRAQVAQRDLALAGKTVVLRQQYVRFLRRHQRLGLDGAIEVVIIEKRQVEAPCGQALDQVLLLAVAQADIHARVALAETGNQPWQVQRRHGFETTDINLPSNGVIVGQGVLFELMGHLQQRLGLGVKALAAGRQRHTLSMVADEQLHPEAFLQAFDGRGNRRLGDVKLARSLRHASGFHRSDEVLELSQGIGSHAYLSGAGLGARESGSWLTLYPRRRPGGGWRIKHLPMA